MPRRREWATCFTSTKVQILTHTYIRYMYTRRRRSCAPQARVGYCWQGLRSGCPSSAQVCINVCQHLYFCTSKASKLSLNLAQVLSLLALLVPKVQILTQSFGTPDAARARKLQHGHSPTQFACFTSTEVQILTHIYTLHRRRAGTHVAIRAFADSVYLLY